MSRSSSLDPKLSRVVLDILKRVCREDGITALVSLHTLELTREYADRVVGLKRGEIVFDGPTSRTKRCRSGSYLSAQPLEELTYRLCTFCTAVDCTAALVRKSPIHNRNRRR